MKVLCTFFVDKCLLLRLFGDVIERIHIFNLGDGRPPAYGKIIFKSLTVASFLLGKREYVDVLVNDKQLRLQNFKKVH